MKLEVDKEYKTAGGYKTKCVKFDEDDAIYPFRMAYENGVWLWVRADGTTTLSPTKKDYDIVSEWSEEVDLTKIEKPFGLLDKETQERLKNWKHGWEGYCGSEGWRVCPMPYWTLGSVYRAKPAPTVEYKEIRVVSVHSGCHYTINEKFVNGKYVSYDVDMVPF